MDSFKSFLFRQTYKEVEKIGDRLAREGSLIMWVMKGRRYLGQVRDGVFHDLRKRQG